jgi:hypothetical protein
MRLTILLRHGLGFDDGFEALQTLRLTQHNQFVAFNQQDLGTWIELKMARRPLDRNQDQPSILGQSTIAGRPAIEA